MPEKTVIHFYSVSDEFGEFSNFAPFPDPTRWKRWPTSEHYFQAQKFLDNTHIKAIQERSHR